MSSVVAPARRGSLDWWVRDDDGRLALVMWPNPALAVWMLSAVVGLVVGLLDAESDRLEVVHQLGQGALVVWALDEVLRGSSPARRVLGAIVLVATLVGLFG